MLNYILLAVAIMTTAGALPQPQELSVNAPLIDTQILLFDITSEIEQQIQRLTHDIIQSAHDGVLHSSEIEGWVTVKD
ncbi:hypothetical protein [Shewanella glacialipiscicola]|uniref:Uncharacterized protein n=1 Tax=Shewanella glacialipiscicola TaxID=614069 RepID=A0ABQ6J3H3_9GAMM|nr:hypothetical protein [Shewanella glacialipiscicola]MCL1084772.1 hypothetical protein [Shewanella glacialipiscicola]GIU16616.1 hypothetical protein TUM4636_30110 [Shewanella glacialipiscicola]GMA82274.1 hypothetical protein GCM10025855_18070 [Shewanella glacialipiscicola]